MDEPTLPDTEAGRAKAIRGLNATMYGLDGAGKYEEALQLAQAFLGALENQAPDDKLALNEVAVLAAWALHSTRDEHAAERALMITIGRANELLERYQKDPAEAAVGSPFTRLDRAEHLVGITSNYLGRLHLEITGDLGKARAG